MNDIKIIKHKINTLTPNGDFEAYSEINISVKNALIREAKFFLSKLWDLNNTISFERDFVPLILYSSDDKIWSLLQENNKLIEDNWASFACDELKLENGEVYLYDSGVQLISLDELTHDGIVHLIEHLKIVFTRKVLNKSVDTGSA
jgi:hypothetical protein